MSETQEAFVERLLNGFRKLSPYQLGGRLVQERRKVKLYGTSGSYNRMLVGLIERVLAEKEDDRRGKKVKKPKNSVLL